MLPIIQLALSLAPVVPELVRWISGGDEKAAEAATRIVDVAEAITGKKGIEAVDMVRADPAAMLEFRQRALELDGQMEAAYLKDRQDARNRDVELARAGRASNNRADAMVRWAAMGTVLGMVGVVVLGIIKARYPDALTEGVFTALLVQLTTITSIFGLCLRDAFQFEFGSSRGSVTKGDQQADLIADLAKQFKASTK